MQLYSDGYRELTVRQNTCVNGKICSQTSVCTRLWLISWHVELCKWNSELPGKGQQLLLPRAAVTLMYYHHS